MGPETETGVGAGPSRASPASRQSVPTQGWRFRARARRHLAQTPRPVVHRGVPMDARRDSASLAAPRFLGSGPHWPVGSAGWRA